MRNRLKNVGNEKAFEDFLNTLFDTPTPNGNKGNKRKPYHIKIVDNETGNVIADTDTNCIIGAFNESNGTRQIGIVKCNIVDLTATCAGAKESIDNMTKNHPFAKLMLAVTEDME